MSTIRLSAVSAASRVLTVVLGTLNLIVVARVLGPEGRGEYVILLAAVTVLTVLADAGLSTSAQSLAGAPDSDPAAMHSVLIRAVGPASALLIGVGLLAVFFHVGPVATFDPETLGLAFLIVPFALYARLWAALMIGLRRIASSAGAQIAFSVALLMLDVIFLVPLSFGLRGALAAYLIASVTQVLVMLRLAPRAAAAVSRYPIRAMLTFGARSYPFTVASLAWSALPPFLLGHYAGSAAVGILSVAQQLSERAFLPILAVQDTAFQRMSSATRADAIETVQRYTRVAVAIMVVVSLGLIVAAPPLVPLLFGSQYEGVILPLQILLLPIPLVSVALLLTPFLLAQFRDPTVISIVAWGQVAILVGGVVMFSAGLDATVMAVILAVAETAAASVTLVVFLARIRGHPVGALVPGAADVRFAIAAIKDAYPLRRGDVE